MKTKRTPNQVPSALKNINLEHVLRKRGIFMMQRQYFEMKDAARPIAQKIIRERAKKQKASKQETPATPLHAQFTNEQVMAYWEKQIHIVEVVEKRFEHKVEQYIKHVEQDFLKHLDSEVTNQKSFVKFLQKDYFDENEDDLLTKAQLDFTPLLDSIATLAGQEAYKLIGINEPYLPFDFRNQIERNVNKFAKSLLDTDREKLVDIISNGLQDGKSVPEIRGMITETFDSFSKMQAQRITRTEVIRASNQASLDAYEQSGVVEGKQWLTAGATDECAQYEGQIVTLSDSFYDSDSEFKDGDPPIHPNCRCVILPIVVGTKAYVPDASKLYERIEYLENLADKRKKAFKELQAQHRDEKADDMAYIKALEKHLGVIDEPSVDN